MATHIGSEDVVTFRRSPMAHRRFLKNPSPSMESASRLFGSPYRHFTRVKCEEQPVRARASISLHLEGTLRCGDPSLHSIPFADLDSKALNLIFHKRCHRAHN